MSSEMFIPELLKNTFFISLMLLHWDNDDHHFSKETEFELRI